MLDKLKADFDGILELVNKSPTALQEMAFRMILEHWFNANTTPPTAPRTHAGAAATAVGGSTAPAGVPDAVKPFLTSNAITTDTLERVFHPIGQGAQLLASNIPGKSKSSRLVNLSLLLCVKHALESGAFTCTLKELRELAVHYDCYDSPNFSKTLKASKANYNPRDKGADLELSGSGRKQAGDLIKYIASGA